MTDPSEQTKEQLVNLLAKFHDPASPYYIPPGTTGPVDENDHSSSRPPRSRQHSNQSNSSGSGAKYQKSRELGLEEFRKEGFATQPHEVLEWPVAWGNCDMFNHVNNVRYAEWFESARIKYWDSLEHEFPASEGNMSGKGTGLILKDLRIRYKAPVTFPDTIMISTKPTNVDQDRATFVLASSFWSLKDKKVVATGESVIVMYDYDNVKKGVMSDGVKAALERRAK